jgi:hypothetical protein
MGAKIKDNRIFIFLNFAAICFLVIAWILYAIFGHRLIEAMYKGESIEFLNSIIEGQRIHPLEHYLEDARRMMWAISLGSIGLSVVLALVIKAVPLLVGVAERVKRHVGRWVNVFKRGALARYETAIDSVRSLVNIAEAAGRSVGDHADLARYKFINNQNDILISLAIAALLHLRFFYYINNFENRYYFNWQHEHALFFVIHLTLLAVAFAAVSILLKRSRNKRLVNLRYGLLLYAFFTAGVSALKHQHSALFPVTYVWLIGLVLSILICIRPIRALIFPVKMICLVLSPLALVLAVNVFIWGERGQTPSPRPQQQLPLTTPHDTRRVYMLIFDEWSYTRLTTNNEVKKTFRHIRDFSDKSLFFRNAYSPAPETKIAMPRLLFQTNENLVQKDEQLYWNAVGPENLAKNKENLFRPFRAAGFFNVFVGYLLPYHELLKQDVDYIKTLRHDPFGRTVLEKILVTSAYIVEEWGDPVSSFVFRDAYPSAVCKNKRQLDGEVRSDFAFFSQNNRAPSFQLYHWPLPHGPLIFNADGSYRGCGPYWDSTPEQFVRGYEGHMRYLDETIGWIVRALRESNQFDSSLIIMTSDHSWRLEPDGPNYKTDPLAKQFLHVPLIIKWPGQSKGAVIEREYHLTDLHRLLDKVLKGTADVDAVVEELNNFNGNIHLSSG